MTQQTTAPQGNPGDIVNWPMLKIHYRTDAEAIAALLPPGMTVGKEPNVNLTVFGFPVLYELKFCVVTTVDADFNDIEGEYTLGYGIDQESAIFISQEMNGQPKYPADIEFYRLGPVVRARCTHQGYTFLEFEGMSDGPTEGKGEFSQHEWWIKVSRAVSIGGPATGYDFPPHVVHVQSDYGTAWQESVTGKLTLRDSPWDPLTTLLPLREQLDCYLWWPTFLGRSITLSEPLDPDAFLPFADTIGGSRYPGSNGGPRRA